jgi:regulator of nonsense transcripts 1
MARLLPCSFVVSSVTLCCSGVTVEQRTSSHDFQWPSPEKPMFFYSQTGAEEISGSGTSFVNRGEASAVERLVTMFLKAGFTPLQVVRC